MIDAFPSNSTLLIYFTILSLFSLYSPEKLINNFLNPIIIETPSGLIQGLREQEHVSFYSIPYARPPIGEFRFKSPQPYPGPWNGILHAGRSVAPKCPQITSSSILSNWSGNEDCLYLNIFTPQSAPLRRQNIDETVPESSLFPVMVWIHGGNFNSGGISDYDPTYFMTKNVVLVMVSFRLGPLGSLNLERDFAHGNQSIEDQTLALAWIQKHIKSFGGNPKRVTIFGESSGSKSVMHLVSNPRSRKYFQSAILQSGVIDWTPDLTQDSLREMHASWTSSLGCGNNVRDIETCLTNLPLSQIMETTLFQSECNMKKPGHPFPNPWTPTLQSKTTFCAPDLYSKVKGLNLMIGVTSNEGYLYTSRFTLQRNQSNSFLSNWKECLKLNVEVEDIDPILDFYFGTSEELDTQNQMQNFTNLISDFWYSCPTLKTVKALSDSGLPPYFYVYDHDGFLSMVDRISRSSFDYWFHLFKYTFGMTSGTTGGASHADELPFLFREYPLSLLKRPVDEDMWRLMMDLWVNFATHGNPNGDQDFNWEPATPSNFYNYVKLKSGKIITPSVEELHINSDRCQFWDSVLLEEEKIFIK